MVEIWETLKMIHDKAIIEKMRFAEVQGMINIYACAECKATVIYSYLDAGITPPTIRCAECGGTMLSNIMHQQQPDMFWYRPEGMNEVKALAKAAYRLIKKKGLEVDKKEILEDFISHYDGGGLFAKETNFKRI
jgi:DNA-directed RNA polymerase subunit RPC12/RpoP